MRRLLSILLFLTATTACGQPADFSGRVVGISDGDTVTVLTPERKQVRIRLFGIDAPESGQDYGQRAKQAASEMAFGKDVTVRCRARRDSGGRRRR